MSKGKAQLEKGFMCHRFDMKPYKFKKGENYMSKRQLDYFHQMLKAWRLETVEQLERSTHKISKNEVLIESIDKANREEELVKDNNIRRRLLKLVRRIDKSIEHLEKGRFGFCSVCDDEIGTMRLEVRPTANLCVDCKNNEETRES